MGLSPVKRNRSTKAQMDALKEAIYTVVEEDQPMTVRQTFYRMVVAGEIDKTEAEYKKISRVLAEMRRAGELDWDWITDNTRLRRKPRTYSNVESAIYYTARLYRKAL